MICCLSGTKDKGGYAGIKCRYCEKENCAFFYKGKCENCENQIYCNAVDLETGELLKPEKGLFLCKEDLFKGIKHD